MTRFRSDLHRWQCEALSDLLDFVRGHGTSSVYDASSQPLPVMPWRVGDHGRQVSATLPEFFCDVYGELIDRVDALCQLAAVLGVEVDGLPQDGQTRYRVKGAIGANGRTRLYVEAVVWLGGE